MNDYNSIDYFKMFQRYEILRSLSVGQFKRITTASLYASWEPNEDGEEIAYNEAFDAIIDEMAKEYAKTNDKRHKVLLNIKNGVSVDKTNLKVGSKHD